MNIALWIVQVLLALAFAASGFMKVSQPMANLSKNMGGWVDDFGPRYVRLIGTLEILGAIGLIIPAVTHILPWLTPVAAIGLALTMIGAMILHGRRNEFPNMVPSLVLVLLAVFVILGRFMWVPISL